MHRARRRLLLLLLSLPVLVLVSALAYQLGMALLEGKPRGFWDSFEWAGETLTTTGYGADSHWRHPAMVVFVVVVQFLGVFLVYLLVPVYLIPVLEERFETRLPLRLEGDLADHLLLFRYGPAVETLLAEAAGAGLATLVLEPDEATARRLFERGQPVLHRGLDAESLRAARLERARAVIANGSDDEDAALILTARQLGYGGPIYALVEEPYHRQPMLLAGATTVFTPRHILGAALAARASARLGGRVEEIGRLGRHLEVAEVRLYPESPLAGATLGAAAIGARTGATVIGQWVRGRLTAPATADMPLEPDGVLVALGSRDGIDRLTELARGTAAVRRDREGPFVVCGYGEVGGKVVELLREVGEEVRVIDRHPRPGVDVVGEVLDLRLLEQAGVAAARAIILALDSDSATLFATVILKDLAPEAPVIARVNQAENVERIHRAGAYFALSISQVSGMMLARRLLGEEAVTIDPQLKVLRAAVDGLVGRSPAELHVRERTGAAVVAVERGEEVIVELGPEFRFAAGDAVFVCGDAQAVRRFAETFA